MFIWAKRYRLASFPLDGFHLVDRQEDHLYTFDYETFLSTSLLSAPNPLRVIPEAIWNQTHHHAGNESYRMPHCGMGSCLDLPPHPALGFIHQVVEFMTDDEPLRIFWEIISHIDLLFVGQSKPESGIQVLSGLIEHFRHDVIR
jgi:hypothetical protein